MFSSHITMPYGSSQKQLPSLEKSSKRPTILIWVHGTQPSTKVLVELRSLIQKPLSLINKELPYAHTDPGLHTAQSLDKKHYIRGILETICAQDSTYSLNNTYVFGWSGQLSFDAREKASEELYATLLSLVAEYKEQYKQVPYIHIITHSHGGNVVLNFGKIADYYPEMQLSIDNLILLACPVQQETACYVESPLFKKIYSLWSKFDMIQIIDPQGLYKNKNKNVSLFSARRFLDHPKLIQVELISTTWPILHISFIFDRFIKQLPTIIQKSDAHLMQQPAKRQIKIAINP